MSTFAHLGIARKTWVWAYDAGNILSKKEYAYTTGTLGSAISTVNYGYGNAEWGDLLTSYNGKSFSYDTIGNLLSDGTWNYTWAQGRQLASMSKSGTTWSFTYDANGMRTQRTTGGVTYNYNYHGSQLTHMTCGSNSLHFYYDASGRPLSVVYNGATYYYILSLQGDVVAILNSSGVSVVEYTYDAWGRLLSTTGSMAGSLGLHNPLRYRGYVYDQETGLYYLQSRYYNPAICRFISADSISYLGADGTITSYNLFVYCGNNPVMGYDPTGEFVISTFVAAIIAATVGGAIAGTLISTVSYVVNCGNNGQKITGQGLVNSALFGFFTGGIGAAAGVIGGKAILIGSVLVGVVSGGTVAYTTEGSIAQRVITGIIAGTVAGFGTFLGTEMPIPTDTNFVAGVTAFVGGLFIGTQAEIVNVIAQRFVPEIINNATFIPKNQSKYSPLFYVQDWRVL